jgi:hypothetical protein
MRPSCPARTSDALDENGTYKQLVLTKFVASRKITESGKTGIQKGVFQLGIKIILVSY